MAKQFLRDKKGNLIYLTDERWRHIIEFHPEMLKYKKHIFTTIKTGKRKQDLVDQTIYTYYNEFNDLEKGFNYVIVIVKFGLTEFYESNNFILTAFQKFIY